MGNYSGVKDGGAGEMREACDGRGEGDGRIEGEAEEGKGVEGRGGADNGWWTNLIGSTLPLLSIFNH